MLEDGTVATAQKWMRSAPPNTDTGSKTSSQRPVLN